MQHAMSQFGLEPEQVERYEVREERVRPVSSERTLLIDALTATAEAETERVLVAFKQCQRSCHRC
jgi:hypothetical protein